MPVTHRGAAGVQHLHLLDLIQQQMSLPAASCCGVAEAGMLSERHCPMAASYQVTSDEEQTAVVRGVSLFSIIAANEVGLRFTGRLSYQEASCYFAVQLASSLVGNGS